MDAIKLLGGQVGEDLGIEGEEIDLDKLVVALDVKLVVAELLTLVVALDVTVLVAVVCCSQLRKSPV